MGLGVGNLNNAVIQNAQYQQSKVSSQSSQTDFHTVFKGRHVLVKGGLSSRGLSDGGCVTVYKADETDAESKMMRVVTRTAEGQKYEQLIDPTKVDPTNATENEMSALLAYLVDEKKLDSSSALGALAGPGKESLNVFKVATEKKNFYALAEEMMKMQYDCHNFASYTARKKLLNAYDAFMNESDLLETK